MHLPERLGQLCLLAHVFVLALEIETNLSAHASVPTLRSLRERTRVLDRTGDPVGLAVLLGHFDGETSTWFSFTMGGGVRGPGSQHSSRRHRLSPRIKTAPRSAT